MPYPHNEAKLAAWCNGLDAEVRSNPQPWHQYDSTFILTVSDYNIFLSKTPGYSQLDWMVVKAQAWVEPGANSTDWKSNVLQIGNAGDHGLDQLLNIRPAS